MFGPLHRFIDWRFANDELCDEKLIEGPTLLKSTESPNRAETMQRVFACCLCLLVAVSFSSRSVSAEELHFNYGGHSLAGHFLAPIGIESPRALLVFVHGDCAMPYDAHGYYPLLWQPLREAGYAIFSWDKPGVGYSELNCLDQSVEDRQVEVRAALRAVQHHYPIDRARIGLLGFSQVGWVVLALARGDQDIGCIVGNGFARNWVSQGRYFTRAGLTREGASVEAEEVALKVSEDGVAFLESRPDYQSYRAREGTGAISPERFQFVMKNFHSDATFDI